MTSTSEDVRPAAGEAPGARVRLESSGGVARLTLTRSDKHNAIDPPMLDELLAALSRVRRDEDARMVVVAAEGPTFCAGVDLGTPFFMEGVEDSSAFTGMRLLDRQHELIEAVNGLPQLTVAAVTGNAVGGGGFGLAMACDIRFVVRTAKFWMVPARLNVVQDFGLTWLLQRAVGASRTLEFVFTGEPVDAEMGERWGFVNKVFDTRDELEAHLSAMSATVGGMGVDAARLLKFVVRSGAEHGLGEQLRLEAIANGLCFQSAEFRAAKSRFLRSLRKGED